MIQLDSLIKEVNSSAQTQLTIEQQDVVEENISVVAPDLPLQWGRLPIKPDPEGYRVSLSSATLMAEMNQFMCELFERSAEGFHFPREQREPYWTTDDFDLIRKATHEFARIADSVLNPGSSPLVLEPGKTYKRTDIHRAFGGQRQQGISTPSKKNMILIFSGASGSSYGYEDMWSDGLFSLHRRGADGRHGVQGRKSPDPGTREIAEASSLVLQRAKVIRPLPWRSSIC